MRPPASAGPASTRPQLTGRWLASPGGRAVSDIEPSLPVSEVAPRDLPRDLPAWLRDRELWRRGTADAAGMFAVLAAASLLLAVALTALLFGTHPDAWPTAMGGGGAQGDLSTTGFLRLWSALFLTAHLVPYTLSAGGASASVAGVGPLLLTALLVVLARRAGRRLELSRPAVDTPLVRAGRGLILSVPYWGLCLVVVLANRLGADDRGVSVGPSAVGLVNVELLVGAAAALGALTARTGIAWSSALRSAVAGLYGMTVGLVVLLPIALVAAGIDVVASSGLPSPASLSAPGIIGGAVCLVAYAPNLLAFVWGAASDLTVVGHDAFVIVVIAPVAGALTGALVLRARPRFRERAAFAAAFAMATAMVAFVSTPSVSSTGGTLAGVSWSTGGSQLRALLVATLVAAAASLVSPYMPLRRMPLWPRFAAVAARVVGAVPTEALPVAPSPAGTCAAPASLRLPRWAVIAGVVSLPMIIGLAIANAILGDHFGVEATVRESFGARAAHDPGRIVASSQYRAAGGGVSLTDQGAL